MGTARLAVMGAGDFCAAFVTTHFGQDVQEGAFECGCVIDGKSLIFVVDDAVGGTGAHGFFDEQAVGGQLVDVGVVGCASVRGAPGFDFDRDDAAVFFDQVIGFACQAEHSIVKGGFDFAAPGASIGVYDPSSWQPGGFLCPVGLPEQHKCGEDERDGGIDG